MKYLGVTALFLSLFAGVENVAAQDIVMEFSTDTTSTSVTLDSCGTEVASDDRRFTDDGSNDGNYSDSHVRIDTVEICPIDQWHRVKVVFTDFDLEAGDSLIAKDGNIAAVQAGTAPAIGTGSGVGVAKAFGGWAQASCSSTVNPSGCITFLFKTDGDNNKGAGWDAWIDCEEKEVTISDPVVADVKLKCDEFQTTVTINAPTVKACGSELPGSQDSVRMLVKNQHGDICVDSCLTKNSNPVNYTGNFAIGQYSVEFILKTDTKKTSKSYFSVQAPSLVCNDELNVPLGSACMAVLTPDDILEQTCDTITGIMYYNITVTIGSGKTKVEKKTTGHDNLGAVQYPIITRDDIADAGMSVCGGTATVKIERIYYGDRDGDGNPDIPATIDCNNGTKSLSCETTLIFSDVDKPWVDIKTAPDTLIACDTLGLYAMLSAKGIDNCDTDVEVSFSVTLEETDPCFASNGTPDTTTATVTYTAVDECGNVGTATHTVTLIRPDIHDTRFIAKTKSEQVECTDEAEYGYPGVRIGIWKDNAFEATDTVYLNTTDYICGYILVKTTEDIPATDCGEKKYIYWDALDWCDAGEGPKRVDTTFVEYTDTTAPEFDEGEGENTDIELDHFSCTYDANKLGSPSATDNCEGIPTVRLDRITRVEDGNKEDWVIPVSDYDKLDCDSFCLRWIAEDACHEQLVNDTLEQIIVIKDVTKPSAVCQDQLNVSLPNEWGARVFVDDIDAGSYDACGIKSRLIRIKGSDDPWAEYVEIGCDYVHPDLQIEMQVLDNKGNENICWLDIIVEDKIKPYCEPLDDVNKDCDEYHNGELGESTDANGDGLMSEDEFQPLTGDLLDFYNTEFGNPEELKMCEDNLNSSECGDLTYHQVYQLIEWPCGQLEAKRGYWAVDWSGNASTYTVEQYITINYKANWKVTFPADWEGTCGDIAPVEEIVINNGACDLLGYEVTEKQFDIPGDACFKIERTYHVINWCKYVAGQDPVELSRTEGDHGVVSEAFMITSEDRESEGYWTYIQVLKVHDDVAPVVTVINPEDQCINGVEFDALPYGEEDQTPGTGPFECDEEKTWTATADDCSTNITWIGKLYDASTGELLEEVETNELTYVVSNKGSYYAEFWAYDNCGNSGGDKGDPIDFWDCKKPTPYVLNGVAVELMETGMVQVWATDLNQNSFDNCTDQSNLDLRIWADFLGDAPTTDEEVAALDKVIEFDCDRVGTNVVYIYVTDEEGNWDFVQTYVIVQDNMISCEHPTNDGGMVAGRIVNPNGENVESVNITVTGGSETSMTTGADGHFMFMLETGADYTVTPVKNINPLNGVSTFDLVLISKHILGITSFDSPFKHIAADVNKSGTITAFDMVQLRQLILNITTEFSSNDSWRFVDASYEFTSANPAAENFGEFYNISSLNANMENLDFVGVKIGDVNGNAQANSLLGAESRSTNGSLTLTATDRFVEAGQTVTVAFNAADIAQAQGYQFTLNFAGNAGQIEEGIAKAANFNTNLANRGVITTSWNGEATTDEVLFSLTFNATASGLLSELVSLSSDITTAEAYNTAGELMDVNIDFTTVATATGFELSQNSPNPFNGETVIGFNLPQAGNATLKVMDLQGKVLKSISADYAKGYNTVSLQANELSATGVLYYQLESADNVATKKMIVIE